ncbi:VOC family protein [Frankia sp. AgB1.9]|uniref:VOC family protein n=1 Tax=unclassified Frankia TaxID=2632575 RepID=UPI0019331286|nr:MULTISPECIES: VOC family protein [unclassified Frankia]MBL7488490.1 VOC family protein [Frankia sp. AgW1.1]MBL7547273.1 VOC family protein [Frankia sp. AgB1.9]MBL7620822.1 VOC family protein [Frankia sp. AgB1.8]
MTSDQEPAATLSEERAGAARDLGGLLGRIGPSFFQTAWVVADLDAAKKAMQDTLGCGEFAEFRMEQKWTLRGERVAGGLALGYARTGNMQVELMQPLAGATIQHEFLTERGPGPHHYGYLVANLAESVAAAADFGFAEAMSGRFGTVKVSFIDTYAELGVYLELIEDPDDLYWATKPWRDHRDQVRLT